MALATGGIALAAASGASAVTVPTTTTVNMVVGHTTNVRVGVNQSYNVATCTSAQPATVACQVLSPPAQKVAVWCLEATAPAGTVLTVTYIPVGSNAALPPTTVTVHCAAAPVPSIHVLSSKTKKPLKGIGSVVGCTTNTFGAACTFAGTTITEACQLAVTGNTLPVLVDATVTVDGVPAINGKTTDVFFKCTA